MMTESQGLSHFKGTPNVTYSRSETETKNIMFGHIWNINKFSYLQQANGESIQSGTFSANEDDPNKWRLTLFPRGNTEVNDAYVSLYLKHVPVSKSKKVSARFEFSILNSNGKKEPIWNVDRHHFTMKDDDWGYDELIKRDDLTALNLLQNDELIICCEVVIQDYKLRNRPCDIVMKNTACGRLTDDLERLLTSRPTRFSDVVLVAEGKPLAAHKALLGARSPVFEAMFLNNMKEKRQNRVVIPDIDYNVLEELVRFIYTGKLPATDEDVTMRLFVAADKYGMEELKLLCEQELSLKLTSKNVSQLITLASLHNANHLKIRLVQFMKSRAPDDAVTELWKLMINQHPQLVAGVFETATQ